jgi:hypothetical protein
MLEVIVAICWWEISKNVHRSAEGIQILQQKQIIGCIFIQKNECIFAFV